MLYVLSCILSCLLLLLLTLPSTSVLLHLVESDIAGIVVIYFRHLTAGIEGCCRIKVRGDPLQFPCDLFHCYTWLIPTVLECIWSWLSKMQWRVSRIISVSESVYLLRRQFRQHTTSSVTLLLPHLNLRYTVTQPVKKLPAVYDNQEVHCVCSLRPATSPCPEAR